MSDPKEELVMGIRNGKEIKVKRTVVEKNQATRTDRLLYLQNLLDNSSPNQSQALIKVDLPNGTQRRIKRRMIEQRVIQLTSMNNRVQVILGG